MTPEQLDMIKKLQPLFKERMGEWQVGDDIYYDNFPAVIIQIKAEGKLAYTRCEDRQNFLSVSFSFANENFIRIPKPIDWQNPERGLWGIIDLDMWILSTGIDNANAYIRSADCDIKADPFTALLKALCQQEGV
jgi:hypothetical protein